MVIITTSGRAAISSRVSTMSAASWSFGAIRSAGRVQHLCTPSLQGGDQVIGAAVGGHADAEAGELVDFSPPVDTY